MKLVVIGGLSGGMTVASQFRRLDKESEIIVYDKNPYVSFANCGLPYYLSREVAKREQLIARTPDQLNDQGITVHTRHEVISVNDKENYVTVKNLQTGETFNDYYDKLVVSPGAEARTLDTVKDAKQSFIFQHLHHLDHMDAYISENDVKHAVVIGTGFIGLEVTEQLKKRGLNVTVIQHNDKVYSTLEQQFTKQIKQIFNEQDIRLMLNTQPKSLDGTTLTLDNGETIDAELIVQAIGILPRTQFLESSNIVLDNGFIPIDEYGLTNIDNVYAIGDAVETNYQHVPNKKVSVALAWPAHRLAYVIANHMAEKNNHKHDGLLSVSILRFFDIAIGSMGLSLEDLEGEDYIIVEHTQNNKAGYMPDAAPLSMRIYVDTHTRKILRASGIGENGLDKRLDILSTLTRLGGTVDDLIDVEVSYAPPFSSPKDIINMLGYKTIGKLK